jgi:photosystem II stability/assembly factor-like uncharacterized protein
MASPIREDLSAVWFANEKTGWVLSDGGSVLKTTDGGRTWKIQRKPDTKRRSDRFDHVWFRDERQGWIIQCCGECGTAGIWPIRFLVTYDGGDTWTTVPDHASPDWGRMVHPYTFTSATGDRWGRGHQGSVYYIAPGSDTGWIANLHPRLKSFGKMFEADYLDVSFASKESGMLAGGNGTGLMVLRTDDGGATWTRQTVGQTGSSAARRVWMSSPTEARLIPMEKPALWATRDGGRTWRAEWTGNPGENPSEFTFPAAGFGIAIGKGGLILRRDVR